MVKWLKIDKQDRQATPSESGKSPFYYISKRANCVVTSEMQAVVALHSLTQSWQDRNRNHTKICCMLLN